MLTTGLGHVFVMKRWFAGLAITASLCTIYITNPSLVIQTLAKLDARLASGDDRAKPINNKRLTDIAPNLVFQIDYCILPDILQYTNSSAVLKRIPLLPLDDHFVKCLLERHYLLEPPKVLNFGILPESWNHLAYSDVTKEISACPIKPFGNNCFVRHCEGTTIRFVKLLRNSDYFTVPVCNSTTNEIAQLILQLEPTNFLFHPNITLLVPYDVTLFFDVLKSSRYLSCNATMATSYRKKHPKLFVKNNTAILNNFDWIISIRDLLHSLRMLPMLAGGSLLGWRRECGIISFTHDFDYSVPMEQYNAGLETLLQNHQTIKVKYKFGKPSDSLEYTLMDYSGTRADIFFLYEEKNYSWVGGLGIGRQKLKYIYPPLVEVCSTSLLGYLFHVPCNADGFIEADYGRNWTEPNRGYRWYNYGLKNGLWNTREWADVFVKYF